MARGPALSGVGVPPPPVGGCVVTPVEPVSEPALDDAALAPSAPVAPDPALPVAAVPLLPALLPALVVPVEPAADPMESASPMWPWQEAAASAPRSTAKAISGRRSFGSTIDFSRSSDIAVSP